VPLDGGGVVRHAVRMTLGVPFAVTAIVGRIKRPA
jgi:hypothetical protein